MYGHSYPVKQALIESAAGGFWQAIKNELKSLLTDKMRIKLQ
jgi:hypothetical protein